MREQEVVASRYRIERKLAAGGFGAIYAATDLVMGREVALKVLHRELAHDALVVARFRREAEALARLRDPHTITMYDVGVAADGTPYIVLELLRGETLHQQFLTSGALPWRRMAAIARGVCSSLREAHAAGIIHRDLKPANIHLEVTALQQDHVKVLDFGIAKLVETGDVALPDLTLAGQMIGTFDYMPPEQLIGGTCTGKTDVFALAVVMYEMMTGELPFGPARGPAGRLMTMLTTPPAPIAERADMPAELANIIMRALSHELEDRPDMEELDELLVRLLEQTSVRVRVRLHPDVATEISALIDEVLTEGGATNDEAAANESGAFPEDDADTWVGTLPEPTTIGHAPSRLPSSPPVSDAASLMKPLGNKYAVGTPAPERIGRGSRMEIEAPIARRVTPAHMPPPPPRRTPPHAIASTQRVTPCNGAAIGGSQRVTPSHGATPNVSDSQGPARGAAVDPLAQTISSDAKIKAGAATHLRIDARTADSQLQTQTARQPRRVLTPPSGMATSSARAEIERLASRPQMPVVRIATPSHGARAIHDPMQSPPHRMWMGRPTPSEHALPPVPHLLPSGELPTQPTRMATGTAPIVNQPARISMVRLALWALALFGVGFAAALGLGAL